VLGTELTDGPIDALCVGDPTATWDAVAEGVVVADPLLCPTINRAPAVPISSAQITPSVIDMFFQTLSSTRLLLSDPSTSGDGPAKDTACRPSRKIGASSARLEEALQRCDGLWQLRPAATIVPQPLGSDSLLA
jgi:hypothetical protein